MRVAVRQLEINPNAGVIFPSLVSISLYQYLVHLNVTLSKMKEEGRAAGRCLYTYLVME